MPLVRFPAATTAPACRAPLAGSPSSPENASRNCPVRLERSFQAELDEFAFSLATRYDAQGLTLFTGPDGVVPTGGGTPVQSTYTGFAALVQVNISVAANPAQTRDGSHDVADDPAGPSGFTVNPPGGPAGSTAMINRILKFALGGEVRSGVAQTLPPTVGLGSEGNLNAAFVSPPSLIAHASALVSSQSAVSATAANRLTTEKSVQSAVTRAFAAGSAVNMDTEMAHMIQLQNAYAANARIITTVQNLLTQLLQAIR